MENFKAKMACCGLHDYYPVINMNSVETVDRPFHTSLSGTYVVNVKNFDVDSRDELHITYGLFTGKYQSGRPLDIKNQTSIMLLPNGEISCYKMGEYESVPHFIKLLSHFVCVLLVAQLVDISAYLFKVKRVRAIQNKIGIFTIWTDNPGVLIGRGGKNVDILKDVLKKEFNSNYDVEFKEIRGKMLVIV